MKKGGRPRHCVAIRKSRPGSKIGIFALLSCAILCRVLVDAGHPMPEVGEAGSGDQAHIAGADHGDSHEADPQASRLRRSCSLRTVARSAVDHIVHELSRSSSCGASRAWRAPCSGLREGGRLRSDGNSADQPRPEPRPLSSPRPFPCRRIPSTRSYCRYGQKAFSTNSRTEWLSPVAST